MNLINATLKGFERLERLLSPRALSVNTNTLIIWLSCSLATLGLLMSHLLIERLMNVELLELTERHHIEKLLCLKTHLERTSPQETYELDRMAQRSPSLRSLALFHVDQTQRAQPIFSFQRTPSAPLPTLVFERAHEGAHLERSTSQEHTAPQAHISEGTLSKHYLVGAQLEHHALWERKDHLLSLISFTAWETQELALSLTLADGTPAVLSGRFSLHPKLSHADERRLRLMWLLMIVGVLVTSLSLFLSRRYLIKPLQALRRLVHEQRQLNAPPPASLEVAPQELKELYVSVHEALQSLKAESGALAKAHLTLQHREGLATAGMISASLMHEIGNPLASVMGLIEHVLEVSPQHALNAEGEAQQRKLLSLALSELKRIEQSKRALLDLTRLPSGQPELISLRELLAWVTQMIRYQPEHRDTLIMLRGALELSVSFDLNALRHALLNLLINAAHAQGDKTLPPKVVVFVEPSPPPTAERLSQLPLLSSHQGLSKLALARREAHQGVMIHILDAGRGVPQEVSAQLFEPFVSSKGREGSGLGLAIASALIYNAGGALWLNERPPSEHDLGGACLSLWVPLSAC